MLDFTIAMNNYTRVDIEDFTNKVDFRSNTCKRWLEPIKGKSQIAIGMVKRAVKSGISNDYLLMDYYWFVI